MDQTKTNVNDASPNNKKESSPFSSGSHLLPIILTQSLDLFQNKSQLSFQVSDIKDNIFFLPINKK